MTKAKPSMRARAAAHDARLKRAAERRRKVLLAIAVGAVVVTAMGIGTIVWRSSSRSSDAATISPLAVELGCALPPVGNTRGRFNGGASLAAM